MTSNDPTTASAKPRKAKKQMSALGFLGIMLGVGVGIFLLRILFGVFVALIARYAFGADVNTASFAGVIAFLIPAFISSTLDLFARDDDGNKS